MPGAKSDSVRVDGSGLFYGWIIVIVGTILLAVNASIINSFGVFFKPLAADFGWNRALTSSVHSASLITNGFFAVVMGWLADRFGPSRVMALCGVLVGTGLVLTSHTDALWKIYLTYGVMTGMGLGAGFTLVTSTTARWFIKRRGLALGIVSSGNGVGTIIAVPVLASLIATVGWSRTYFLMGLTASSLMLVGACLLRRSPESVGLRPYGWETSSAASRQPSGANLVPLYQALRSKTLWLMFAIFSSFSFCGQMMMVHLVNYATDAGMAALVAAGLVSVVGLGSTIGRFSLGLASDRIGNVNAVILCCAGFATSLVWLSFAGSQWMIYLFAIVFGISYGGEMPQQAALVARFFGVRMALVGAIHFSSTIGSSLGIWMAGYIFDTTRSYQLAFLIGVAVMVSALMGALVLRKRKPLPALAS